jgi:hypothetical protein
MSSEWFCRIMGDEWGPMSEDELVAVARRGRLTRNDMVREGKTGTWVRGEVVQGLFEHKVPASTGAAPRSLTGSKGLPARRSVRQNCARKYWVQVGENTAGPFTGSQLKQLASLGKLKPYYLISGDHIHWVRASQVKGLTIRTAPTGGDKSPAS